MSRVRGYGGTIMVDGREVAREFWWGYEPPPKSRAAVKMPRLTGSVRLACHYAWIKRHRPDLVARGWVRSGRVRRKFRRQVASELAGISNFALLANRSFMIAMEALEACSRSINSAFQSPAIQTFVLDSCPAD